jgi:hypothetical protein
MTEEAGSQLPVRGLHVSVNGRGDVDLWDRFIREEMPAQDANLLVMEVNYSYAFRSRPEAAAENGLSEESIKRVVAACRAAGVELVPQVNCFGHQSWGGRSGSLLRAHPEFDERPDIPQDAGQETLYCRSYCPRHPQVHDVLFDLIDELVDVFEASQFHVGMDEVFLIAEEKCPRCSGADPAEVFADEVTALHNHLAGDGTTMWMWGDRFINSDEFPTGRWEGSANGTWASVDTVPKDIVICDWHYEKPFETPGFFIDKGFRVVASPWRKQDVALDELDIIRRERETSDKALGMLQTTWCGFDRFLKGYYGEVDPEEKQVQSATESADCFRAVFAAMRGA